MMLLESRRVRRRRSSHQSRKWRDHPPPPFRDKQKTMWEGSGETLETLGNRTKNNKRMHEADANAAAAAASSERAETPQDTRSQQA